MTDSSRAADGAVVEPFGSGTTSGLTAVDQARGGHTSAIRTIIAAPVGSAVELAIRAIGYSVVQCGATATATTATIDRVQPHVVFLDAAAPDAAAVVARVIADHVHPPIIVVERAAVVSLTNGDAWLAAGAEDHLTADQLTPTIVRRAVESAIARGRARELRLRLGHADRLSAIATLAAGVAHEVNNPAAYVLMNLRTCRDHLDDLRRELLDHGTGDGTPSPLSPLFDEMREMFDDNMRGVERIVSIIQSLRAFARPEPDEIEQIDLAAVCRDVHELVGSQLHNRARVTFDLQPVPTIAADRRKLSQVVINLLVNAADAIPTGETGNHSIRVRLIARGARVELSVSDSGIGIPPAHRDRIFEPFFTTRPGSGASGLGLATVRSIVERFGGRITVESSPHHGTTFVVSLPQGDRPRVVAPRVAATGTPRGRVMIIDDEVALTSALRRQLRGHHDVTVMNDGAAALAAILRDDYDVILCDVMMPGTDGIVVLENLRQTRPDLVPRLVLMTAGVFAETMRERVLSLGGQLLDKPVPIETLLGVIGAIRGRTALQAAR